MSATLVTLHNISSLIKHLGLKDKTSLRFSVDGECLFLKGIISGEEVEEKEVLSSSGKSTRTVKALKKLFIMPELALNTTLVSKVQMCRIFVEPNPSLLALGQCHMPRIIEPCSDDKIWCELICKETTTKEDVEKLDHFARVYVIS